MRPHAQRVGLISILFLLCLPWSAQALDYVRVQLKWLHQFQFAGYYAAVEKGFYRDAGLDVHLLQGSPGLDPANVVLSGQAEFGVGTPDILLLRAKGEPLVVLGVIFQHSPYIFLQLEKSKIHNVADLAGTRLMMEPMAAELYAYLAREKVPLSDLKILDHTFSANALIDKKTDSMSAYSTDEPFTLYEAGIPYSSFSPQSAGVDFYGDCFFTVEKQLKEHPERVKAFYEATLKGWQYAMDHPEEIIHVIQEKYLSVKSREALLFEAAQMRKLIRPELVPVGYMYEGRWQHIMDTYHDLGMLDRSISLKGFLYDPHAKPDWRWLYWGGGIGLGCLLVSLAVLYPMRKLNRGLKLARDRAERNNRAMARFLAMVSHELRTPMNGVLGFAGLLRQTSLSPEQQEYVRLIDSSSQSLLKLVDDLLDLSKIEAGRVDIDSVDFSLRRVIDDVVGLLDPLAVGKGVQLESQILNGVPDFVRGDPLRIRQVLINLLGNALKFTEQGSVKLICRCEATYTSGDTTKKPFMEFIVTDTGPGMTPQEIIRVFEPFAQGNIKLRLRYGGTGLGLPISKRLAELMRGSLEMTSQIGKGTTVRFRLPLPPIATSEKMEEPRPSSVSPLTEQKHSRHILIAEDDLTSAKLMTSILRKMGHEPEIAETGRVAVEKWTEKRPSVVFMDMRMPDMGGIEAIRYIRAKEINVAETRRTFIIALTAEAEEEMRQTCLLAGADRFMTKPVRPEMIREVLSVDFLNNLSA